MSAIIVLIGVSLTVAVIFLIAFIWSVKTGQYEDKYTPSVRMLFDDNEKPYDEKIEKNKKKIIKHKNKNGDL